ncbi:MAG: biopolymer transporter ExbD [Bacteroidales bacterium]|nr:biopolymer transporter ExbD [Bacteroidales bacterium]
MAKFAKKGGKGLPPISTASLPDIIFMLLFFFMVTTTMRQSTLLVKTKPAPDATEVQKLEQKSLVSFIYIGPPMDTKLGTDSRIQLNESWAEVGDITEFIQLERESRNENDRKKLTTSLKVNKETKMGIVTDVKQELRQVGAFKINYSTAKRADKDK